MHYSFFKCYKGLMLARKGKAYMRNVRRYCNNLRPLTVLNSCLAVPSKVGKKSGLMWVFFKNSQVVEGK